MFKLIDNFLNKITMYRLTLYSLIVIWLWALGLSLLDILSYNPFDMLFCGALIFTVCVLTNQFLAWIYKAPSNIESSYITAFILMLIISPARPLNHISFLVFASILAIASKYILAIHKKHIFNPAAIAVVITAFGINEYASWWIGTFYIAPVIFITGFLIVRKIQLWDLVLSFFITSAVLIIGHSLIYGKDINIITRQLIFDSPWMFFAFIMLTEPQTAPPTRKLRIIYGGLTGLLFGPFIHIGNIYSSPELALVLGNVFSYLVSPKEKLILILKEKVKIASNTYDFIFSQEKRINFKPGQYMEWTLSHKNKDARGIRRYFTIASSPTEQDMAVGVKFYSGPSSYKKALDSLQPGSEIVAAQMDGDFTLPKDSKKKLVFLAGGIGVTPFRSMIKYLIDTQEKRDIIMLYANNNYQDIAYENVFSQAQKELGITMIYTLKDTSNIPAGFAYQQGIVDKELLIKHVPDFKERVFYISGPKTMVDAFTKTLKSMGVHKTHIKTDFFPGFA